MKDSSQTALAWAVQVRFLFFRFYLLLINLFIHLSPCIPFFIVLFIYLCSCISVFTSLFVISEPRNPSMTGAWTETLYPVILNPYATELSGRDRMIERRLVWPEMRFLRA